MTEFKVNLDNKDIEWRHKYEKLEKQNSSLHDKYLSKCMEVKDKENILNRFLHSK